jgi:hypothetical protein
MRFATAATRAQSRKSNAPRKSLLAADACVAVMLAFMPLPCVKDDQGRSLRKVAVIKGHSTFKPEAMYDSLDHHLR